MEFPIKSLNRLTKSFGYAISGLIEMVKTEKNARIHLVVSVCVIALGIILAVNPMEWCVIFICIALVWAAEALNTSIEELTNHLFKEYNHTAKKVKDISAGAVLVCAIISVICGIIIFLPKLLELVFA